MRALYMSLLIMLIFQINIFGQQSIDFESLTEGTIYSSPSFSPGDVIGAENGISITLENFEDVDGNLNFLNVQVRNTDSQSFTYAEGNFIFMGAGLKFDFSSVNEGVKSIYFFYQQNNGLIKNLSVNGVKNKALDFDDFPTDWGNGTRMEHALYDNTSGVVRITGDINELIIAGEGLEIDHLGYNISDNTEVYPGDSNNDGKCNYLDLINIGVNIGTAGASRSDDGLDWAPQDGILWADNIQPNASYSDVNGDGIVDTFDHQLYLEEHLGKSHNGLNIENPVFVEGESTEEFSMFFRKENGNSPDMPDTIFYNQDANEPFSLELFLLPGSVADTIYGISWIWRFNTLSFDVDDPAFVYEGTTGLGVTNSDVITVLDDSRISQGIIGCAMVRTDGQNIQVTDRTQLGTFNGIIVDLKGFQSSDGNIELDSIQGVNNLGEPIPVFDLDLPVFFDPITNLEENPFDRNSVIVFPNPAMENIYLNVKEDVLSSISSVALINEQGQSLSVYDEISNSSLVINAQNYPSGNYFVEVRFKEYQSLVYKIQIK